MLPRPKRRRRLRWAAPKATRSISRPKRRSSGLHRFTKEIKIKGRQFEQRIGTANQDLNQSENAPTMAKEVSSKEGSLNGDDYVKRLSKAAGARRLKRAAEQKEERRQRADWNGHAKISGLSEGRNRVFLFPAQSLVSYAAPRLK